MMIGFSSLFADDTEFGNYGYNLFSMTKSKVQMSKEIVYITIKDWHIKVHCKFWFYNHGKTQKLKVGFPDFDYFYHEVDEYYHPLKNFKSLVNGKPVKMEHKIVKWIDSLSNGYGEYRSDTTKNNWFVKTVNFPDNDTTVVENYYEGVLSSSAGTDFAELAWVDYYLGSGFSWFGNIDTGIVVIDYTDFFSSDFLTDTIKPANKENFKETISENMTVFEFHDYKPDKYQLLRKSFYCGFYEQDSSNLDNNIIQAIFFPAKLDRMNNEVKARAGLKFTGELDEYFKSKPWYKSVPKNLYKEYFNSVNDECKGILSLKQYCRNVKPFKVTSDLDENKIRKILDIFELH